MPSDGWYKSGHLRIENTTHCSLVCQRLTPLVTSRWGLVCRRAICSKQARCRAVSCTRGKTVGAGAMAVGIRHACREHWALFRSYDTIPPSVRRLLPSTTSDGQGRERACLPPATVREVEPRAAPARRCAPCGRDGWQSDGTCEWGLAEAVQARLEEQRHLSPVAQAWDAAAAERACDATSSHQPGRRPAPGAV